MVDDHVEHGATRVDDTRKLVARLLHTVAHLNKTRGHGGAAGGLLQHVAAIGRHDIVPIGAQQGDVLHHDLAAHTHLAGKRAARYGPLGPLEHGHDGTATLAGDALQALAFETILKADLPALRALKCAQILANAAGHEGICGGQQLDLEWEGKILSAPELEEIYLRKTSALIRAACLMGVAAAGGTKEQDEAAAGYADNFGFAFQLRDDMLDVIGDEKTFGKPIGSDREEGKTTFVDILGLNGCQRVIEAHSESAVEALGDMEDTDFLIHLVRVLEKREQ